MAPKSDPFLNALSELEAEARDQNLTEASDLYARFRRLSIASDTKTDAKKTVPPQRNAALFYTMD